MYHKIRITVVSLVVVVICVLSSTATLSYFTDHDVSPNSFTVGNASTTLMLYDNAAGGSEHVFDASNLSPLVDNMDIPLYLQATNDGNIPVYQRFRVVIPIDLGNVVALGLPTMDDGCEIVTTSVNTCSNEYYTVTYNPAVDVNDTPTYAEYYIVSNNVLPVGQATREWPMMEIRIGDISSVNKSLFTCTSGSNNNCVLGINTYSDTIQTAGFISATDAFNNVAEVY